MSGDLKIQGVVEVSAEGVDQTFNRVGDAAGRMSNKIEASAEKASKAVDGIGSGANQNAEQFTRAEGKISASIKRATTNLEQLNKTASEKLEIQIATQGLDASKFELQLQKLRELENAQNGVSNSAQSLGKSMEYVGSIIAAGGSGFVYWIKGAIDAADSLNDLSKSTGIAVDTLSGLQLASRQSGAELEGTAQAINKLSVNIGSNAAKFAALGITAKEPIEAFKQLADIFSKIDDPQTRAALGAEALGKSWASTAPLLAEGGASIQKMVDKGILLSGVTQGLADDSDAFNDALEEMKAGIQGAANSIAGDLLPVMLAIAKGMDDVTDNAGEMSSSFSPVAETMRAVAVLGGNVAFVLRGIGTEFGGMAAQVASAMRGDFAAAKSIGEMMKADAEKSRASFDKWEAGVMSATKTLAKAKDETDKLSGAQQKAVAGFIAGNANSSKAIDQAKKDAETIANLRIAQMIRVSKEAEKELTVLEKQQDEYAKALQNALGPLEKQAAALELEVQNYGLTEAAIQSNIVTRMEEARVIADANGAWPEHLAYLDKEIELRKQIATASSQKAFLETNKKAAEESAKEWEEFSDDINRALTDALMHGFEDGKSFGQNFVDSLKNSLKTAALKIVVNMVTSTGGSLANAAINAVAGTSSANDGAGANYFGLANNANSVYSLYGAGTQFFTGASTGSSSAGLMYANGTQLVGGDGIGALYTANGGWAGVDAGTGAASGAVAGEGAGVTGGSSAAGTIAWVAAIVMGMYMSSQAWKAGIRWENYAKEPQSKYDLEVYLRAQKDKPMAALFGKDFVNSEFYAVMSGSALSAQIHYALQGALFGKNRVTGTSVKGAFSEAEQGFSGQQGVNYKKSGGLFSSSKEWTEWNAFPAEVDSAMDSIYRSTRNSFIMLGEVFEDTTLAEKIKGFIYSFSAGDFSADDVVTGLQSSMSAVLTPSVNAAMKAGESWSQALGRIMQETQAVSRIFDMMGKDLVETFGKNNADSILKASDNLVTLFGTIDSLNASFGAYYGNFYTAEEQTAQAWKDMGKAFDIIGLALPKTRQEFRSLVDGLDLTTVSGEVTFKRLMDLQSGFAALTPAMEDVAAATTEIIDAAGRKTWGDKLSVLNGSKTQRQISLANDLAGTTDTSVQDLIRQVYALEDAATAAATALQTSIDTLVTTFGDVAAAMLEINPPAKTLVESWRDNKTAMQSLQGTFDQFFGESIPNAAATIQNLLTQLSAFEGGIATARGNADNARVHGMTPAERVTFWRTQEATLWQGLGNSTDKAGTISKIMEAYGNTRTAELEALTADQTKLNATTKTGLQTQLEAWQTTLSVIEKAKSFAKDLEQFMGSLAFSDLSALNYTDQLAAAGTLYSTTLAGAQSGDVNAMGNFTGNAQSYLEEARAMFGSGLEYANIYTKVTGDASGLGLSLNQDGTQAQSEIDRLTTAISGLTTTIPSAFAQETSDGYIRIANALTPGADYTRNQMNEQKRLLEQQIVLLQSIIDGQQAQIAQQEGNLTLMLNEQKSQTARLTTLESNTTLAGAGA